MSWKGDPTAKQRELARTTESSSLIPSEGEREREEKEGERERGEERSTGEGEGRRGAMQEFWGFPAENAFQKHKGRNGIRTAIQVPTWNDINR